VESIKNTDAEDEEPRDPKSILCSYFKQGLCQKGKKCKYSHDLSLESNKEVIDVYTDQRTQLFNVDEEDCKDWSVDKLKEVIN